MTDDTILKKVIDNLGQIAAETGTEAVKEVGQITETVITGKELLGDIKPLSNEEMAKKQAEDDRNKQEEINKLRNIPGRNIGGEIEKIRDERKREEEEREKQMLEQVRRQREAEEEERVQMTSQMGISSNPAKQKKSRGSAFAGGGKKKTQQPDPAAMSQTSEFKGGKID